eukprot:c35866_g1_i1 orf=102-302(+)
MNRQQSDAEKVVTKLLPSITFYHLFCKKHFYTSFICSMLLLMFGLSIGDSSAVTQTIMPSGPRITA